MSVTESTLHAASPLPSRSHLKAQMREIAPALIGGGARPDRLVVLADTGLLSSSVDPVFDRFTRLASRLLDTPLVQINLIDATRQFSKSSVAPASWPNVRETPLADSFCKLVVDAAGPVVIEDARLDERVAGTRTVRELGLLSYLGSPLVTPDGHALGALCVGEMVPRVWTQEEADVLGDLATAVMSEIELRGVTRTIEQQVSERTQELEEANAKLAELLDAERARAEELRGAEEALRKSEATLRAIVGASLDIVKVLDEEGRFAWLSRSITRVLGYTTDELVGVRMVDVVHPEDVDAVELELVPKADPEAGIAVVYRARHHDGRWVELEARGSWTREGEKCLVLVVRDVTAQTALMAKLVRARAEANRANVALSECLSRMSHELRTPLNAILGFGQLLEMQLKAEDDRENVQEIMRAGDRLLALIDKVPDVAD